MGDRANIVIDDNGSRVFLYTHWDGHAAPEILREALARRERWDDPQYLARIIFQQMIGDDKSPTGYGISAVVGDNSYPFLIVDCAKQVVRIEPAKHGKVHGEPVEFPIAKFAALESADWNIFDTGRAAHYAA